ncbi:hypothetical protein WAI453_000038 [Rhynchosporium graminicola]|uniref:Methyltransferase domain-containing protein n=1 Tax=Rhynchosporium graminicola TaxID=2792576 RepID=A0A1E1K1S6_9HELO|nr:uncharacterized protein RCO7_10773 [Rhynchosporium commune]
MLRLNPVQILLSCSAAFFILVLFTHFGTDNGITGVSSGITGVMTRGSVKSLMARSEKIWMKTVKQRHEVFGKYGELGFFPAIDGPTYFAFPYSVWDLVPASWNCPHEVERIGRMGDGGKWVCGMSRYEKDSRPCILYSFGVQNESSFEQEMLQRTNCEIWGYDFSVEAFGPAITDEYSSRTHFLKAGIGGSTDEEKTPPFYSIQDLMKKNGHTYIDILKIDVEYAEFEAMTSLLSHTASLMQEFPIGQMLMEIHLFDGYQKMEGPQTLGQFLNWWEELEERGVRPAWTEPNLLAVTLGLEDQMPRLAEYTFVNVQDRKSLLW